MKQPSHRISAHPVFLSLPSDVLLSMILYLEDLNDYVSLSRTSSRLRRVYHAKADFWRQACEAAGYGIPAHVRSIDSWRMLATVLCKRLRYCLGQRAYSQSRCIAGECIRFSDSIADAPVCPIPFHSTARRLATGITIIDAKISSFEYRVVEGAPRSFHITYGLFLPEHYSWSHRIISDVDHEVSTMALPSAREHRSQAASVLPPVRWALLLKKSESEKRRRQPMEECSGILVTTHDVNQACQRILQEHGHSNLAQTRIQEIVTNLDPRSQQIVKHTT